MLLLRVYCIINIVKQFWNFLTYSYVAGIVTSARLMQPRAWAVRARRAHLTASYSASYGACCAFWERESERRTGISLGASLSLSVRLSQKIHQVGDHCYAAHSPMRRALAVRRISGVVHARALCNRAREPLQWAALKALDVRLSLCARGDNHQAHFVVARFL